MSTTVYIAKQKERRVFKYEEMLASQYDPVTLKQAMDKFKDKTYKKSNESSKIAFV
jgi:hypothetical protein